VAVGGVELSDSVFVEAFCISIGYDLIGADDGKYVMVVCSVWLVSRFLAGFFLILDRHTVFYGLHEFKLVLL
jgi:hypothetical protein